MINCGRVTIYFANFDFDDRLGGAAGPTVSARNCRLLSQIASVWTAISGPQDTILVPGDQPPERDAEEDFVPWGWDSLAARMAGTSAPSSDVMAATQCCNDRRFAARFCPDAVFSDDASEIGRRVRGGHPVVLKTPHGGCGRGQLRLAGGPLPAGVDDWIAKRAARGGLVVEPYFAIVSEFATHFDICRDAVVELGRTWLRSDAHGQFAASVAAPETPFPPNDLTDVAEAARGAGYRGPLSVDSAVLRDGTVRRVQDVNARWTVGRLTLLRSLRDARPFAIVRGNRGWIFRPGDVALHTMRAGD